MSIQKEENQTFHPGFTLAYYRTYRLISYGHRDAEKLAIASAKKGHKVVYNS